MTTGEERAGQQVRQAAEAQRFTEHMQQQKQKREREAEDQAQAEPPSSQGLFWSKGTLFAQLSKKKTMQAACLMSSWLLPCTLT